MDKLSIYSNGGITPYAKKTDEKLYELEQPTINVLKRFGRSNVSLTLHTSMVYGFAIHLPYSMDIEQEEYVPGDFLNIEPHDVNENVWFKEKDRRTYFNAMVNWGDSFKSGMLLQICFIFQQMLLGNISIDYSYNEQDYKRLGIDKLTSNEKYNKNFFDILSRLPLYYQYVVSSSDVPDRRKRLEKVYSQMCQGIEMRVGGFRKTDVNGNVVIEQEAAISWSPWRDVEMLVYWDNVTFFDGLKLDITKQIKEEQLKSYNKPKNGNLLFK